MARRTIIRVLSLRRLRVLSSTNIGRPAPARAHFSRRGAAAPNGRGAASQRWAGRAGEWWGGDGRKGDIPAGGLGLSFGAAAAASLSLSLSLPLSQIGRAHV